MLWMSLVALTVGAWLIVKSPKVQPDEPCSGMELGGFVLNIGGVFALIISVCLLIGGRSAEIESQHATAKFEEVCPHGIPDCPKSEIDLSCARRMNDCVTERNLGFEKATEAAVYRNAALWPFPVSEE